MTWSLQPISQPLVDGCGQGQKPCSCDSIWRYGQCVRLDKVIADQAGTAAMDFEIGHDVALERLAMKQVLNRLGIAHGETATASRPS
jgi:hypothetical protein